MEQSRLIYLSKKWLDQTATDEEIVEFYEIVKSARQDNEIKEEMAQGWLNYTTTKELPVSRADAIFNSILQQAEGLHHHHQPARVLFMKSWKRIAVAASIILVLGVGSYFAFFNKPASQNQVVKTPDAKPDDVRAPMGTKAMITLANGQQVSLDSIKSGTLATEGEVNVIKTAEDQIVYNGSSTEVAYNTLFNPRGSKVVSLTLNDGTKVWLNSESSLRYPTSFTGNERTVEITGEAYFEVVKDATKKFIVTGNGVITEVLGTHFNVNTYRDENNIKVTLLEGSVKVTKGTSTGLLKPGQQAQVNSEVKVVSGVNVETATAWRNGLFSFDRADIQTVMRQIGRWYDIEVVYKGRVTDDVFGGDIQRGLPLSKVLDFLQKSQVHFVLEGRKLIVLP